MTTIQGMMKEGAYAIRAAVTELEALGYLLRVMYRDKETKRRKGSFLAYTTETYQFDIETNLIIIKGKGWEPYLLNPDEVNLEKPVVENQHVDNHVLRILSSKKTNKHPIDANDITKEKYITKAMFPSFWELYPHRENDDGTRTKGSKGKAKTKWDSLCSRKKKDRLTWHMMKGAVLRQKNSSQWQDKRFIPRAEKWLNNQRWLDDPKEMVNFSSKQTPDKPILAPRIYKTCFVPALELMHVSDNGTEGALLSNMHATVEWYLSKQKRPTSLNLHIPDDLAKHTKWQDIPDEKEFLAEYIDWLSGQEWLDGISETAFRPTSKLLQRFKREYEEDVGFDLFTGKSI